jgi:hypothetical protein
MSSQRQPILFASLSPHESVSLRELKDGTFRIYFRAWDNGSGWRQIENHATRGEAVASVLNWLNANIS